MSCIFCEIANGNIPANKVYEDDSIIVFHDLEPQAPVHLLAIPKQHISSANNITPENAHIISHIFQTLPKIATKLNVESGYRIVTNCGEQAGQSVLHLHFHLLAGRSMKWPPG